jgi:multidrug resistance efflux pump
MKAAAAGQRAFLLLDLSSVVVSFSVPDGMVGQLAIGQPVDVTCDALSGRRFAGLIHKIGSTRTYAVEVRVDRPEGL